MSVNIVEHKITLTLGVDEKRVFDTRKRLYKKTTGKHRSNSEIFTDILTELEEIRQISKEKGKMIDLQFQENVNKLIEIKKYVAREAPKQGKKLKLDYATIFKHTKKFNDLIAGIGDKKCT